MAFPAIRYVAQQNIMNSPNPLKDAIKETRLKSNYVPFVETLQVVICTTEEEAVQVAVPSSDVPS